MLLSFLNLRFTTEEFFFKLLNVIDHVLYALSYSIVCKTKFKIMLRLIFSLFFFLNIASLYSQESNIDDPYLILSKSHDQKLFATLGSLKVKNDLIKKLT